MYLERQTKRLSDAAKSGRYHPKYWTLVEEMFGAVETTVREVAMTYLKACGEQIFLMQDRPSQEIVKWYRVMRDQKQAEREQLRGRRNKKIR